MIVKLEPDDITWI